MKVNVATYRDQTEHLFRVVGYDASSCVGQREHDRNVMIAKRVGLELINMVCRTAKPADITNAERAIDRSADYITKHSTVGV